MFSYLSQWFRILNSIFSSENRFFYYFFLNFWVCKILNIQNVQELIRMIVFEAGSCSFPRSTLDGSEWEVAHINDSSSPQLFLMYFSKWQEKQCHLNITTSKEGFQMIFSLSHYQVLESNKLECYNESFFFLKYSHQRGYCNWLCFGNQYCSTKIREHLSSGACRQTPLRLMIWK